MVKVIERRQEKEINTAITLKSRGDERPPGGDRTPPLAEHEHDRKTMPRLPSAARKTQFMTMPMP